MKIGIICGKTGEEIFRQKFIKNYIKNTNLKEVSIQM